MKAALLLLLVIGPSVLAKPSPKGGHQARSWIDAILAALAKANKAIAACGGKMDKLWCKNYGDIYKGSIYCNPHSKIRTASGKKFSDECPFKCEICSLTGQPNPQNTCGGTDKPWCKRFRDIYKGSIYCNPDSQLRTSDGKKFTDECPVKCEICATTGQPNPQNSCGGKTDKSWCKRYRDIYKGSIYCNPDSQLRTSGGKKFTDECPVKCEICSPTGQPNPQNTCVGKTDKPWCKRYGDIYKGSDYCNPDSQLRTSGGKKFTDECPVKCEICSPTGQNTCGGKTDKPWCKRFRDIYKGSDYCNPDSQLRTSDGKKFTDECPVKCEICAPTV